MSYVSAETVVRSYYSRFANREPASLFPPLSCDVDWKLFESREIPIGGHRLGEDEVIEFFATMFDTVEIKEFGVDEIVRNQNKTCFPGAGEMIVFGSERCLVRATGKEWAVNWIHVHTVDVGLIQRFRGYTDTAAIRDAYVG